MTDEIKQQFNITNNDSETLHKENILIHLSFQSIDENNKPCFVGVTLSKVGNSNFYIMLWFNNESLDKIETIQKSLYVD